MGLLGQVACNGRDSNVNSDGGSKGRRRRKEVDGDVEGAATWMKRQTVGRFSLDVVGRANNACKWGNELTNTKGGIAEVIMESVLEFFGEAACEEMVAVGVDLFTAIGAFGKMGEVGK